MSPSSPNQTDGTPDTSLSLPFNNPSNRRISGRVRNKPALLSDDAYLSQTSNGIKRKRLDPNDADLENLSDDELEERGYIGRGGDGEDNGPDEEEVKEKKRKARGGKKPVAKRARAGEGTTSLAMRPAGVNGVGAAAKKAGGRSRKVKGLATAEDDTGLFGLYGSSIRDVHTLTWPS